MKEIKEVGLDQVLSDTDVTNEFTTNEEHEEVKETKKSDSDVNLDFSELVEIPGVIVGDTGKLVSRYPVEKARFTVSARSRIAILTNKVYIVRTVYDEDLRMNIIYNDTIKIAGNPQPKVRYLYPIIIYDTDKSGKIQSGKIENAVLALSEKDYSDLITMAEIQNVSINQLDIVVTCNDEKYQSKTFTSAGPATWKKSKKVVDQVMAFWKVHLKDIVTPVAVSLTQEEYDERKGLTRSFDNKPDTIGSEVDVQSFFSD